jgi:hypothetical protein
LKKFKILHIPATVGGNAQTINCQMKLLGIESYSWALSENSMGLGNDADKFIYEETENFFVKEIKRFWSLRYVFLYRVVFFNFGSLLYTPFPSYRYNRAKGINFLRLYLYSKYRYILYRIEIGLLKLLRVNVFVQYQGSDARQKDYCRSNFQVMLPEHARIYTLMDRLRDENKRAQIKQLEHFAKGIYSLNPDLMHVLPSRTKFLPYCHIDLDIWKPVTCHMSDSKNVLKIGHAPSNRDVKGTDQILKVIKELQPAYGKKFEFQLIENIPYDKVMHAYQSIDILIDQIYGGWYGGLAVEAMALGKPVLCYIREDDLKFVPTEMVKDLPIIKTVTETLKRNLISLIEMPYKDLVDLGKKSRQYVEKWHCPRKIVRGLIEEMNLC